MLVELVSANTKKFTHNGGFGVSDRHSIKGAILNYLQDTEAVQNIIYRSREEARQKENELCAKLVEEFGHKYLAELIRNSARW